MSMHMRFSPLLALLLLAACGATETIEYKSGPITLTAEGPLFAGSNTAQGTWEPDLAALLDRIGAKPGQLRSARIVEATLSGDLTGVRGVVLQLASDNLDMGSVAVLNPLPEGRNDVALQVANEQRNTAAYLKEKSVTVVADLDLDADSDEDRHVIGSFTIELNLRK
jgi:hypothetical protein